MQIIFDGINSDTAPDVLLPDYEDFDPEYDDITSLVNWDKSDESCLLRAVQDIMGLASNFCSPNANHYIFVHMQMHLFVLIFFLTKNVQRTSQKKMLNN